MKPRRRRGRDVADERHWERSPTSELAMFVRREVNAHLDTYELNPTRVTEDARHESSILEAAYRQRQLIELVQNGADAIGDSVGGRIEAILTSDTLYVANTGEPLTSMAACPPPQAIC